MRGPSRSWEIALSFDDGPHPENTPRLLDVLSEHRIQATFFLVGDRARRNPALVRRIAGEGHAIGNHSLTHRVPTPGSLGCIIDEANQTRALLNDILGNSTDLYRPPFGWVTARGLAGLWRSGFRVILWNVNPRDFAQKSVDDLQTWFARRPTRGGDLVLLHDDRPMARAILPQLSREARDRGLRFVNVETWLGRPDPGSSPTERKP